MQMQQIVFQLYDKINQNPIMFNWLMQYQEVDFRIDIQLLRVNHYHVNNQFEFASGNFLMKSCPAKRKRLEGIILGEDIRSLPQNALERFQGIFEK